MQNIFSFLDQVMLFLSFNGKTIVFWEKFGPQTDLLFQQKVELLNLSEVCIT